MEKIRFTPAKNRHEYPDEDSKGQMTCPNGFALRWVDGNTLHCEGGAHEYKVDTGSIVFDKFGSPMIDKSGGDTGKEEKRR